MFINIRVFLINRVLLISMLFEEPRIDIFLNFRAFGQSVMVGGAEEIRPWQWCRV